MTRTTIRLDEQLMRQAKELAARTGRTFTSVVEDALRQVLASQKAPKPIKPFRLPTFKGNGLRPGVHLDDTASLRDIMDEGLSIDRLR